MERYEREKSLSIYWANRANDLRGAAGAVWFAIENESKSDQIHKQLGFESGYSFSVACPAVFMMLCGLSLELLYKALIIEISNQPPAVHDLRRLSVLAQITMSADDLDLIDILTAHIKWAGKYPVPRGDKAEWDEHVERMDAALTDPVPDMCIRIVRRNERLYWDDYSRIWNVGATRYWELYHQRSG
jgi:HEPN domain-containing protein